MKKELSLLLLFASFFIFSSCEQKINQVDQVNPDQSLSVSEAKNWFTQQIASGKLDTKDITNRAYWGLAFEHKFDPNGKSYVIVPIYHHSKKDLTPSSGNYRQLWIYRDKEQNMTLRVIEYILDSSIPLKSVGDYSLKNFRGTMVVRNWDNGIVGGFYCENGILRKGLYDPEGNAKTNAKSNPNGRPTIFLCGPAQTYVYGYNYSAATSAPYYWTYSYATIACCWIEALYDSFAYADAMDVQIPMPSVSTADLNPSGSGWSSTYDKKFQVMANKCQGYLEMLNAQDNENKEMLGLVTSDGKIVVLPSLNNSDTTVYFVANQLYYDLVGRPLIYFDAIHKEVSVYYYQTPDAKPTTVSNFSVVGLIHSHPIKDGAYWDDPSPDDYSNAANYSDYEHYIVNRNNLVKYNSTTKLSTNSRYLLCGY